MIPKPYRGDYKFTLEFGDEYGGILGIKQKFHEGLDVALPCATPIFAPAAGEIHKVNDCAGCSDYGKYVELGAGGSWILLAHLSEVLVQADQQVKAGQLLGRSGSTGKSTGCHLHIGVHDLSKFNEPMHDYQNPREYIDFNVDAPQIEQTPPQPQPAPAPAGPKTYVVQSGDSLWKIAAKFYGRGSQWPRIFEANRDKIDDPDLIHPGLELVIPE